MEVKEVPDSILAIHASLGPYLKQRNEATTIRRILAAHLGTCLRTPDEHQQVLRPLSFSDTGSNVEGAPTGVRGVRRDYLRCVKANLNARKQYEAAIKESGNQQLRDELQTSVRDTDDDKSSASQFLEAIIIKRKHDRLRILQDYVDMLGQKPAAAVDHFALEVVLKDVDSLPQVPQEVFDRPGTQIDSDRVDLKDLVDQLEKSVLRAKLLLKKEQKLLEKVRAESHHGEMSSKTSEVKLQALGTTRNELINWIETELGKAGDSSQDAEGQGFRAQDGRGKDIIERELLSIRRQYSRYITTRTALILAVSGQLNPPIPNINSGTEVLTEEDSTIQTNTMCHIMHPYLEDLAAISNQQKSVIQQRSHLTTSLAKQLKESTQGLDLLIDESHLLPAHPSPSVTVQRKAPASFAEEISAHERPDTSQRAKAWVFASDSASTATKEYVLKKLEDGQGALLESRAALLELQQLLGVRNEDHGNGDFGSKDIWENLNGRLGVINADD